MAGSRKRRRSEDYPCDEEEEDLQLALALSLSLEDTNTKSPAREAAPEKSTGDNDRVHSHSRADSDPEHLPPVDPKLTLPAAPELTNQTLSSIPEIPDLRSPSRRNLRPLPSRRGVTSQESDASPSTTEASTSKRKLGALSKHIDDEDVLYDDDSEDLYHPQESDDDSSLGGDMVADSDEEDVVNEPDSDSDYSATSSRRASRAQGRKAVKQKRSSKQAARTMVPRSREEDDELDRREGNAMVSGSWSLLASELKDDYVERQLKQMRESAGLKEAVRAAALRRAEEVKHQGQESEPRWTMPPLGPNWSSKLSPSQLNALYAARTFMFGQIYILGEAFRLEEKRSVRAKPGEPVSIDLILNGHYVAAAVSFMRLPILPEDLKLMILSANTSMRLDESAPTAQDAANRLRENDKSALFKQSFRELLKQAKWPTDEVSSESDKTRLKGAVEDARKHPAFLQSAPTEYDLEFGWAEWCAVFDHAKLRVEKSGKVW